MSDKPYTPNISRRRGNESLAEGLTSRSCGTTRNTSPALSASRHSSFVIRHFQRGFTLVEMLTVIAIIGIIAGLSVPLLKNFGKSDVSISASRQMLDDIGHARQLAMSQRTTVYMVFLPTNFWTLSGSFNTLWFSKLNSVQQAAATNLLDKQLAGYAFMAYGALGDQPGQHQWHYLTSWQSLPDGAFIPLWKFSTPYLPGTYSSGAYDLQDPVNSSYSFGIGKFTYTNTFPFPTQDSTNTPAGSLPLLPFIAFNYLGQLSDYSGQLLNSQSSGQDFDQDFVGGGVDIPIAQGSVIPYVDQTTKMLLMTGPSGPGSPQVVENPPGNSTNISYNVVHIDALTGRATLECHKVQ
jgi:prepilin-type N-terminal cleavage/methylation domain-containing protein